MPGPKEETWAHFPDSDREMKVTHQSTGGRTHRVCVEKGCQETRSVLSFLFIQDCACLEVLSQEELGHFYVLE